MSMLGGKALKNPPLVINGVVLYPGYKCEKFKVIRDKDGSIDCKRTKCPFKEVYVVRGFFFGLSCWLRGKVYEYIASMFGFTLYIDMNRESVEALFEKLKEKFIDVVRQALQEENREKGKTAIAE